MYTANFDGASKGNPGPSSIGAVLYEDNLKIWTISKNIGYSTVNEAEYLGLISLLKEVRQRDIVELTIRGDSQMVINQMSGSWKCHADNLKKYYNAARRLADGLKIKWVWVPRSENSEADRLCNQAFS